MHINKLILLFLAFLFRSTLLPAQQAVLSAGGELRGEGGTISWSMGQVAFNDQTTSTGEVAEGVQQPLEVLLNDIQEMKQDSLILVYPDPVVHTLNVNIEENGAENLTYQLNDAKGAILLDKPVERKEFTISFDNFQPSVYYLVILENAHPVKTCKIIKQ